MPTKRFALHTAARSGAARLLLATVLAVSAGFAAKHDNKHSDAFIAGDADENRIARQVRHGARAGGAETERTRLALRKRHQCSCIFCPTTRARTSTDPPGAKGTIIFIGFSG